MIISKAPGSLMLMGEHVVLTGSPAIIQSLDQFITVSLEPLDHPNIEISSPLGALSFPAHEYPNPFPASHVYVLHTLKAWLMEHPLGSPGLQLSITSEFLPGQGLGSSTAVVVALVKALNKNANTGLSPRQLFDFCLRMIRDIQGVASGADVAASLYEGCIFYEKEKAEVLPYEADIEWEFSGIKVPTAVAIDHVAQLEQDYRQELFDQIQYSVLEGKRAIQSKDAIQFASILKTQQRWMERLFLDTPGLNGARERLEKRPGILATKISGAGLGDGVIGFKGFF